MMCQLFRYDVAMTTAPAEPRWLETPEHSAWRAYLDMTAKLSARLNRDMQQQAGISSADYAVLVQLSEHVDARMRVLELARSLGWEKSRLSHQLTRMQQRGLIERSNCNEDRRGAFILLTEKGRATVVAAAPRHVAAVRRYVFDELTAEQVAALDRISRTVADVLDTSCESTEEVCDDPDG